MSDKIGLDVGEQFLVTDSSNSAPSFANSSNTKTGMRITADGNIRFSANGEHVTKINNYEVDIDVPVRVPNGSANRPTLTFSQGKQTGLFRIAPDIIGITTAGTEKVRIDGDGILTVSGNAAQIVYPSYSVNSLPKGKPGGMIFVTDDVGGSTMAFYDGKNWRRFSDRSIISKI